MIILRWVFLCVLAPSCLVNSAIVLLFTSFFKGQSSGQIDRGTWLLFEGLLKVFPEK